MGPLQQRHLLARVSLRAGFQRGQLAAIGGESVGETGSFGKPIFRGAAQHVIEGGRKCDAVTRRNEEGISIGAATQHRANGLTVIH